MFAERREDVAFKEDFRAHVQVALIAVFTPETWHVKD